MQTISQLDPLRSVVDALKADGPLALVPTMGALHAGHLSLVRAARAKARHVAVSIFVNPRQFGPKEDLARYPRPLEADCALLAAEGVSLVWVPDAATMYPQGYATTVSVSGVSEGLCGAARPGHFDGVATVVCKLFNQVRPDMAFFGEKDWQQLAVIRTMARDLDLIAPTALAIQGVPTMREADGLAMSSRNGYLSAEDRARAGSLPGAMQSAIAQMRSGRPIRECCSALEQALRQAGFTSVDYAEVRSAALLEPVDALNAVPCRLFVAVRIGGTRLIDNMAVN